MVRQGILALSDGTIFEGVGVGATGLAVGEVVFNTSMTGYQEILTDPSYHQQLVTLTAAHVGNTGVNDLDVEAPTPMVAGFIVRDVPRRHANWRATGDLPAYLAAHGIVALSGVNTRRLTHVLRETGAQAGCILVAEAGATPDAEAALAAARAFPGLNGADLARVVSCETPAAWSDGRSPWAHDAPTSLPLPPSAPHVVAYDFGIKREILRLLTDRGCRVTVVPATTPAADVLAMKPDGVFLSNGPGDPEPVAYAQEAIVALIEAELPVFGICLGHQLLCLALGARSIKMKFGHHGANHPVRSLGPDPRVFITSQNHGFAIDAATLPPTLRPTHVSLFDGSLQGVEHTSRPVFSFQGHPEASPGPRDIESLFDRFAQSLRAPSPTA